MDARIVIGSRGSRLALWQANWARDTLLAHRPGLEVEILVVRTRGDRILDVPFARIEGKGLFTTEIEERLLDGRIDLAVHSLKDLPTEIPEGLALGAVSRRADVRDALVSRQGKGLAGLRRGARVGTSSLRRQAQLRHIRPDLMTVDIRGNVDTRLKKLDEEGLDAVVLAAAGLERLGWGGRISEYLPADQVLPAPGQGALAIEVRAGDARVGEAVSDLDDEATRCSVTAERAMLQGLGGGCHVPIGAWGRIDGAGMVLDGIVAHPGDGRMVRGQVEGATDQAERLGARLAGDLLGRGGAEILEAVDG